MNTHRLIIGAEEYWNELISLFGIEPPVQKLGILIKANGDVYINWTDDDGQTNSIKGLVDRQFLIEILDKLSMPVDNHVLEIEIEADPGQLAVVKYVCGIDDRIKDIDWSKLQLWNEGVMR